ncbi:MAG: hypothetical protein [Siphoviridae sp. ctdEk19]|nr:MAG: hypothetical protein [Siphoviridae sp. ctdEk19]
MAFDGNGTYNLPTPEYPALPGTLIESASYNAVLEDLATALSTCMVRDGQATALGNWNMGGYKLQNLANGVTAQDAVTFSQVFTSPSFSNVTATGATFTVTATAANLSAVTTCTLPSGTSIGSVDASELAYLNGVTSAIQTQFTVETAARIAGDALKANLAGGNTFTGTQNLVAALTNGSVAATQVSTDSSTLVATTAFVQSVAFSAALPNQAGNNGSFVTTNGTTASWQRIVAGDFINLALGVL